MDIGGERFVRIAVVAQGQEDRDGNCRVTLHRLRRKLGDDERGRKLIETVPGVGLRLQPN